MLSTILHSVPSRLCRLLFLNSHTMTICLPLSCQTSYTRMMMMVIMSMMMIMMMMMRMMRACASTRVAYTATAWQPQKPTLQPNGAMCSPHCDRRSRDRDSDNTDRVSIGTGACVNGMHHHNSLQVTCVVAAKDCRSCCHRCCCCLESSRQPF